ncbi:MAG: OmpP1/FadL family transporter [Gammaproteobacteria bacterium]
MGKAKSIAATMCTIGVVALSSGVIAGGFALFEQSVKGLGNAFAGSAAVAEDAATLFFNPAGLTRLHDSGIDAASHLIIPSLSFQDRGSHLNQAVGGAPITASDDGDGAHLALIPNLYYAHSYDERLKFGAAVNVPFAFLTDYEAGWQGRYHALRSDGMAINLNVSAAYRFNELLSMGVGFDAQYIDATFSNALDFSTLCLDNPASAPACGVFGLSTPGQPATDGHVEFSGNDWSYGYNIGLLLEPTNATRIGVHYRSHIQHEVGGEADFTVPVPAFAAATGAFQDTGANATLDLPDSLTVSAYHPLGDRWAVLGDITWTHWSRFDQVVLRFDNPRQPALVTPQDWDDTFRYALGVTYHPERRLILRSGLAYDETPIPNPHLRSPRIPDQDRVWLTFGASYQYSEALSIDVGYAHLFIDDAAVDNTEVITGHVLTGDFKGEVDILAVQLVWRMR